MRRLLTVLFIILTAQPASADLKCFLEKLKSVKSMKILFSQRTKLPVAGDEVDLYSGVIYYKRPLHFRWEYKKGSDIRIISNGELLEVIFPSEKECQVTELSAPSTVFPLFQIIENPENLRKLFKVLKESKDGDSWVVGLSPTYKDSTFERVTLFIDGSCNLRAIKTYQFDGTEATYIFREVTINEELPEKLFELEACE
ncbi:LolA family protein [Phorcysia thermohydrogeniphila]|uniref:Outer membrane lipoprotein carrier protein n=1 Tax=Phorcysia thermohydrogeniphila TaxID=936138 RepID=A0A4R1GHC1_9BACT|nr:outer membrane lipoprotein carrier protein LolA [Phorcysia thermohydrogeniphila]TCK06431.1 outer membrane lipoprotein carrier protein [Phorcysia thermohydrogeniphila]